MSYTPNTEKIPVSDFSEVVKEHMNDEYVISGDYATAGRRYSRTSDEARQLFLELLSLWQDNRIFKVRVNLGSSSTLYDYIYYYFTGSPAGLIRLFSENADVDYLETGRTIIHKDQYGHTYLDYMKQIPLSESIDLYGLGYINQQTCKCTIPIFCGLMGAIEVLSGYNPFYTDIVPMQANRDYFPKITGRVYVGSDNYSRVEMLPYICPPKNVNPIGLFRIPQASTGMDTKSIFRGGFYDGETMLSNYADYSSGRWTMLSAAFVNSSNEPVRPWSSSDWINKPGVSDWQTYYENLGYKAAFPIFFVQYSNGYTNPYGEPVSGATANYISFYNNVSAKASAIFQFYSLMLSSLLLKPNANTNRILNYFERDYFYRLKNQAVDDGIGDDGGQKAIWDCRVSGKTFLNYFPYSIKDIGTGDWKNILSLRVDDELMRKYYLYNYEGVSSLGYLKSPYYTRLPRLYDLQNFRPAMPWLLSGAVDKPEKYAEEFLRSWCNWYYNFTDEQIEQAKEAARYWYGEAGGETWCEWSKNRKKEYNHIIFS